MEKKRRDYHKWKIDAIELPLERLEETIGYSINKIQNGTCTCICYALKPEFGTGNMVVYELFDMRLCIRNFSLHKSIILNVSGGMSEAQLSFLLSGEVLVCPHGREEIIYEHQESYLARTDDFKGQIIISKSKPFHEIILKMNQEFLVKSGLEQYHGLKYFLDKTLISPIDLPSLKILQSLEPLTICGLSQSLFLEAKTIELIVCQLEYYKKISENPGSFSNKGNSKLKKLYKAKELIEVNLNINFGVSEVARQVGLNDFDLKKQFKEIFGCSVNRYARSIKMEEAKNLLSVSDIPIYEIAEMVGYKNATHFSAAFKKYFNKTPKEFKQE